MSQFRENLRTDGKTDGQTLLPLFISEELGTSKIDCGDKIWKKPCLLTFSSGK